VFLVNKGALAVFGTVFGVLRVAMYQGGLEIRKMLSVEILLVYFFILSHLYSTVERCKLIRISYEKDVS
jgi:hypothetical protein